jgi:hypothetical protein
MHLCLQTRSKILVCVEEGRELPMHELCMGLEHERMHQETLCYMLAQQRRLDYQARQRGSRLPAVLHDGCIQAVAAEVCSMQPMQAHVPPFYLQQASYQRSVVVLNGMGGPARPLTPRSAADRAASKAITARRAGPPGIQQAPNVDSGEFVVVPAAKVSHTF